MTVRTRYAPSPTGRMHVGNLRTALYEYLIARHAGGQFILRIEDTDQERYVEGAVDLINRTLAAAGLDYDEGPDKPGAVGPYVQSERVKSGVYMRCAEELVKRGEAYYCFCTKERLDSLKTEISGKEVMFYDKHCLNLSPEEVAANLVAGKPFVIRQNNPRTGVTKFEDEIYGTIEVENAELDDMVLIKSDGFPTYNFANVVDDHLMGITHVVRGNEYLSSTPKYLRLYEAFGWQPPVFVHLPLITDEEHKKLSKRSGHSSFEDLTEQGFVPEAIVNFVALLGWSPEENREIFSLQELIERFDYSRVNKSPAVFDVGKLRWMNGEYIKAMEFERFKTMALPWVKSAVPAEILDENAGAAPADGPDASSDVASAEILYECIEAMSAEKMDENTGSESVEDLDVGSVRAGDPVSQKTDSGYLTSCSGDSNAGSSLTVSDKYDKILSLVKSRIETFADIPEMVDFFAKLPEYDVSMYTHKKMKTNSENSLETLKETLPILEAQEDYSLDALHDVIFKYIEEKGVKNGIVLWPLRTAVSGKQSTPGGAFEIMEILGKAETLRRIRAGINMLEAG